MVTSNGMHQVDAGTKLGARFCAWQHPVAAGGDDYSISVNIYDKAGLDQLSTTAYVVSNFPIGHHQGRLSRGTTINACLVSIGITVTSRVDVVGIPPGGKGTDVSCQLAELAAPSVEQRLPVVD
jgi:hypothetical protein